MSDEAPPCPKCGAVIDAGDRFCGDCGAPNPVAVAPEPPRASLPPLPPVERPPARRATELPPPEPPPRRRSEPQPIRKAAPPPPLDEVTLWRDGANPDVIGEPEPQAAEAAPDPRSARASEAPASGPGFWARHRGFGLTAIRVALGFLFVYPKNPLFFSDPWFTGAPDPYFWEVAPVEFWVQAAALADNRDFFYLVCTAQIVAGALIVLGLVFRPACFIMFTTFMGIWAFVFDYGSGIEIQLQYLGFAFAFLGLLVAGPGKLALRRRRD